MNWKTCLSAQSRKPSGIFGRMLMGRYLDRANIVINQLVYDSLAHTADSRLLEIGFGGAELLLRIAASLETGRIDGLDLSPEMVARAGKRARRLGLSHKTGFYQGSVDRLPFAEASFDCACSVHTIYFWPDLEQGLAELARVVKPGGRLVLGFSSDSVLREEGWVERGFKAYSNEEISETCRAQGFMPDLLQRVERKSGGSHYAYRGLRK